MRVASILWILVVLAGRPATAEDVVLTNAEAADAATEVLLEDLLQELPPDAPHALSLRSVRDNAYDDAFEAALAPRLLDRGWRVWLLDPDQTPPEGSLLLEYQVLQADLRYLRERRGFLSLGTPRIEREVVLELEGRLRDPEDGRVWWTGSPLVRYADDFPGSARSRVEAQRPDWVRASPSLGAGGGDGAGFWEKAFVVGLLGGVVALYVGGAR
jgi:hypothetical protein